MRSRRTRSSSGSDLGDQVGALAGLTSVILVMILAQARIFLTMAQHGLLPPFRQVHPKYRTPDIGTVVTGVRGIAAACCRSTC